MAHWDAAVVVLRLPIGKILGVTRGRNLRDINLPGGLREPEDRTPEDTARRELMEETGLMVDDLKHLATWRSNGKVVVAFQGKGRAYGELRTSPEGVPIFVAPRQLMVGTYGRHFARLLPLL
jgi:8-oxo-dGTP pyrophosphatase MutT (NUDIX family)